jgi:IclR family acetate operon transcriptional repressor
MAAKVATRDPTSLEKGLALLQEVATAETGMSIAQLAEATGLNRTTTYRLCEALEGSGWLQLAADGTSSRRRVALGPRALGLAVLVNSKYDPETRLEPLMDNLARTVGETVHAGMLDDTWIIHVSRSVPEAGLHMAAPLGSRELAHVTALGKAMLATLSREELLRRYRHEELLVRTGRAISTRAALLEELEHVAARGYAIDDEESRAGVRCIGAPIFGPGGDATLAFSVTTMPVHLEGERLEVVARAVRDAAELATAALGGAVPATWGAGAA